MNIIDVSSIKELFDKVLELNKENNMWFRGQKDSNFRLLPSLRRQMIVHEDYNGRPIEPELLSQMYNASSAYTGVFPIDGIQLFKEILEERKDERYNFTKPQLEQLGQHYKLPTMLLDWTTDFFVALFFLVDGYQERNSRDGGAIFVLDPRKMNEIMIFDDQNPRGIAFKDIPAIDDLESNNIHLYFPAAVKGETIANRIVRQSGNFVTFRSEINSALDTLNTNDEWLVKIVVDNSVMKQIKKYLPRFGITRDSIYSPDSQLEDITQVVSERMNAEMEIQITEWTKQWEEAKAHKNEGISQSRRK